VDKKTELSQLPLMTQTIRTWRHARSILVLGPMLTLGLVSACGGVDTADTTDTSEVASAYSQYAFLKHGNNGTVNCATYCAGSQWGQVGRCLGVVIDHFPCGQRMGFLPYGAEDLCSCSVPGTVNAAFPKGGNNGTASCSLFCAGPQWGPVGSCVDSQLYSPNNDVFLGPNQTDNYLPDCSFKTGLIQNGAEMTCVCK
jgi:hypothetical protein